jgi:hypothetical protein
MYNGHARERSRTASWIPLGWEEMYTVRRSRARVVRPVSNKPAIEPDAMAEEVVVLRKRVRSGSGRYLRAMATRSERESWAMDTTVSQEPEMKYVRRDLRYGSFVMSAIQAQASRWSAETPEVGDAQAMTAARPMSSCGSFFCWREVRRSVRAMSLWPWKTARTTAL